MPALFGVTSSFVLEYDKHILRILAEAGGSGLSVQKITRHVFNVSNTFFNVVVFEDVHKYVQSYLLRNSKSPDSIIERMEARGMYRLNLKSGTTQQMMLQFVDKQEKEPSDKIPEDQSLSLF